ncbi:uncharacterized protein LOC122505604 [Leptopilina heterotoma]|uniref:uncharacterized protein LOC122505604 n=1 Tax=Leptopilina heterotoma TaxID=63436 RepID=UPI001CA9C5A9|nr:uncharacterized protein LOC122505604 [Leptopilina heterotoma]
MITASSEPGESVVILKDAKDHKHAPNREECEAEVVKARLKRRAEDHPEQPPAQILRSEFPQLSEGVISQLPDRENIKKAMRRRRQANLPPNPTTLEQLQEIPDRYRKTIVGETFLIYDSIESSEDRDSRVLVFSTRRNLELLFQSSTWFLDGTFKVSPNIFTQVFTILGMVKENVGDIEDEEYNTDVALPLVYALLSSKESAQYSAVLTAVKTAAQEYHIDGSPAKIMTDFEQGILNSCAEVFPDTTVLCCFFHLGQSVYRRVQAEGLQTAYNHPTNREIKNYTHMMLGLAFVPPDRVKTVFQLLAEKAPEELLPVLDYFNENYITGRPARGRRRAIPPRYQVHTWNQHKTTMEGSHRTNNNSEDGKFVVVLLKNLKQRYIRQENCFL